MFELRIDGKRLRELREAFPMTQGQMEIKSGVKQDHISKIETGKRTRVRLETLGKLAQALEVSPSALLIGASEARTPFSDRQQARTRIKAAVQRALGGQQPGILTEYAIARIAEEILKEEFNGS